jgi:WD40 repeat protein
MIQASTKTGSVVCYDIRNPATPLWKIPPASDTAVASLSFSVGVRGLLAAASEDGTIRLYDVEEGPKPACVGAKDMAIVSSGCLTGLPCHVAGTLR